MFSAVASLCQAVVGINDSSRDRGGYAGRSVLADRGRKLQGWGAADAEGGHTYTTILLPDFGILSPVQQRRFLDLRCFALQLHSKGRLMTDGGAVLCRTFCVFALIVKRT